MKIALLPGDGIGPEIMAEAEKIIGFFVREGEHIETETALVGGAAVDKFDDPLPDATLELCLAADAVLFGSIGGPQYDTLPRPKRPERGLLRLRKAMDLFANLRPARVYEALADSSTLKKEVVAGLDIMIVRELTGDIYFGEPRGIHTNEQGLRCGVNTMTYDENEIKRVAHWGFQAAQKRRGSLCSVDKMNVLETTQLWRDVVIEVSRDYPDVKLTHMLVDNAAMQLIRNPQQFDVIVTGNLFGDILSDEASMLTGSIGLLPSASLNQSGQGLFEPIHGSAPDIAGRGIANPLAQILSLAMMFRYSLKRLDLADRVEAAVETVINQGIRTQDIARPGENAVSTSVMGDAVMSALAQ
jgi:3-isopropylmalate dehydrogenase